MAGSGAGGRVWACGVGRGGRWAAWQRSFVPPATAAAAARAGDGWKESQAGLLEVVEMEVLVQEGSVFGALEVRSLTVSVFEGLEVLNQPVPVCGEDDSAVLGSGCYGREGSSSLGILPGQQS